MQDQEDSVREEGQEQRGTIEANDDCEYDFAASPDDAPVPWVKKKKPKKKANNTSALVGNKAEIALKKKPKKKPKKKRNRGGEKVLYDISFSPALPFHKWPEGHNPPWDNLEVRIQPGDPSAPETLTDAFLSPVKWDPMTDLDDEYFIDPFLRLTDTELVDEIQRECGISDENKRTLSMILANAERERCRWWAPGIRSRVIYPRRKEAYVRGVRAKGKQSLLPTQTRQVRPPALRHWTWRAVLDVVDSLRRHGHLDHTHGFSGWDTKGTKRGGKRSTFAATTKLRNLLARHGDSDIVEASTLQRIVMKNPDKVPVEFEETDDTLKMGRRVDRICTNNRNFTVELHLPTTEAFRQELSVARSCGSVIWELDLVRYAIESIGARVELRKRRCVRSMHWLRRTRFEESRCKIAKRGEEGTTTSSTSELFSSSDEFPLSSKFNQSCQEGTEESRSSTSQRVPTMATNGRPFWYRFRYPPPLAVPNVRNMMFLQRLVGKVTEESIVIDLQGKNELHRVFNNLSWARGGRFYGATIQNLPSGWRRHIRINGEECVELDYSSFHIRMLYHRANLDCGNGDLYTLEVPQHLREHFQTAEFRAAMKQLTNIALNAETDKAAKAAYLEQTWKTASLNRKAGEPEAPSCGWDVGQLLYLMKRRHAEVSEAFCSGVGLELQNIDAWIAEKVMLHFAKKGRFCLGIHDSFIVAKSDEAELRRVMLETYKKHPKLNGSDAVVK